MKVTIEYDEEKIPPAVKSRIEGGLLRALRENLTAENITFVHIELLPTFLTEKPLVSKVDSDPSSPTKRTKKQSK